MFLAVRSGGWEEVGFRGVDMGEIRCLGMGGGWGR